MLGSAYRRSVVRCLLGHPTLGLPPTSPPTVRGMATAGNSHQSGLPRMRSICTLWRTRMSAGLVTPSCGAATDRQSSRAGQRSTTSRSLAMSDVGGRVLRTVTRRLSGNTVMVGCSCDLQAFGWGEVCAWAVGVPDPGRVRVMLRQHRPQPRDSGDATRWPSPKPSDEFQGCVHRHYHLHLGSGVG